MLSLTLSISLSFSRNQILTCNLFSCLPVKAFFLSNFVCFRFLYIFIRKRLFQLSISNMHFSFSHPPRFIISSMTQINTIGAMTVRATKEQPAPTPRPKTPSQPKHPTPTVRHGRKKQPAIGAANCFALPAIRPAAKRSH